jgi:hypothetical protein
MLLILAAAAFVAWWWWYVLSFREGNGRKGKRRKLKSSVLEAPTDEELGELLAAPAEVNIMRDEVTEVNIMVRPQTANTLDSDLVPFFTQGAVRMMGNQADGRLIQYGDPGSPHTSPHRSPRRIIGT